MTDGTTRYRVEVTALNAGSQWLLSRWNGQGWDSCRRSRPEDAAAFAHADQTDWLSSPPGSYEFEVTDV